MPKTTTRTVTPPKVALWKGPEQDGITFSMLSRWLVCRERFRIQYLEGIRPNRGFNHRIEYGQMWHTCEEALAKGNTSLGISLPGEPWQRDLTDYCRKLMEKYPLDQEQIEHWYQVCRVQFPEYVKFWAKHPHVRKRVPLEQEEVFDVPYKLPSGRVVRLRGKRDMMDQVGKQVWLQENKTKGDVEPEQLERQMAFDLQTMMYVVSCLPVKVDGVRYNVVRRPLSGGKGSIRQHKPTKANPRGEGKAEFYERVRGVIREEPEHYFFRLEVNLSSADVRVFRDTCLDPMLDALCNWYDGQTGRIDGTQYRDDMLKFGHHWRHPFGVRNIMDEGGATDLDQYLQTGSMVGLERVTSLFEELT